MTLLLVSALAPSRLSAQQTTEGWEGGSVEVDSSSLNIANGGSGTYRLRLTKQPTDDGWWVRVSVDGVVRADGIYDKDGDGTTDISWVPSVGWPFNRDNWNQWRSIQVTVSDDFQGSIAFTHDVWDHTANCPVHNVGTVTVRLGANGGNDNGGNDNGGNDNGGNDNGGNDNGGNDNGGNDNGGNDNGGNGGNDGNGGNGGGGGGGTGNGGSGNDSGTPNVIKDSGTEAVEGPVMQLRTTARALGLGKPLAPTPAKIVIWTDQPAYQTEDELMLYRTMDPMGDENQYTLFFYRENIETGERSYFGGGAGSTALSEGVIDHFSMREPNFRIARIEQVERQLIWSGVVPEAGLWHFVAELRSPDTTQVLKRAYAKFVVAKNDPTTLGEGGAVTEIATDTTWANDTIYRLRAGVTVKSGATLTIEHGTVIQAKGTDAGITVEKGGRIVAEGRREAPVLITCEATVGERESGCWSGLTVRGNAPVNSEEGSIGGMASEMEPLYGGDQDDDSSGVLRFVRVEFGGGSTDVANRPAAIRFHGVGSGTTIDHVQAHSGAGDGIAFLGGTAHCGFCVSSGAQDDSLDWAEGWQGTAQHMYVQQGPRGEHGIEASDGSSSSSTQVGPRAAQYNVTLVGGASLHEQGSSGDGIRLDSGATLSARNAVLTGFGGAALDVQGESVAAFMAGGASSLRNAIFHTNGGLLGAAQIRGGVDSYIDFTDTDPMLRNVRYEGNPDPRPMIGSPALEFGVSAIPPSDGVLISTTEYIGAFGAKNWLEEWTFFGPELDYAVPETN